MIPELGHFALILALAVALVQGTLPLVGASRGDARLMALGRTAALTQAFLVILAFGALTQAYVTSDFSVANVVANSHSAKPLIYKISGVWGNHEGSMLLWALILSLFGAAVAIFGANLPDTLRSRVLAIQALIGVGFLAFLLFTSNPFERVSPAPIDGNGLNPLLQDPGLAFHPPLLYLGYVGFSVTYAFAIAALLEGRVDAAWARWVRPWTLAAWCFLTLGIALGSWWAYYILGWGGFWFWDPVENASLMPWLAGTALLHSAIVVEKRDALKSWTVLLAILAFSLSLLGTFLVRSGVLTSVHAFAQDPARGMFILAFLLLVTGGGLTLYAWRAPKLTPGGLFQPISREGALILNNLLLCTLGRHGAAGHALPALPRPAHRQQGLGRPALLQRHLRADLRAAVRRALRRPVPGLEARRAVAGAAAAAPGLHRLGGRRHRRGLRRRRPRHPGRARLRLRRLADPGQPVRILQPPAPGPRALRRLAAPPPRHAARVARHDHRAHRAGLRRAGRRRHQRLASRADAHHEARRDGFLRRLSGDPAEGRRGEGRQLHRRARHAWPSPMAAGPTPTMQPERRLFLVQRRQVAETAIHTNLLRDFYVTLGEGEPNGGWVIRLYLNPLAPWIWLGAAFCALGGFVSLSDRRLRIGAPSRRPVAQPAE